VQLVRQGFGDGTDAAVQWRLLAGETRWIARLGAPRSGRQVRPAGDAVTTASLAAARATPQGQRVTADVANYATGGAVVIHYRVQDGTG
jgi:hypothetical protein